MQWVRTDQAVSVVATFARDTLDFYIQEIRDFAPDDPYIERKITEDPYMVAEVEHMRTAINLLLIAEISTENLLDKLEVGRMVDLDLLLG